MASSMGPRGPIVVPGCKCGECSLFGTSPPNPRMHDFTMQSYDFDFQFPKIRSEIGDGDRSKYDLNPVTKIFEDIDRGIPRDIAKTAEIVRFVTYKNFDADGFVLPLMNFGVICDILQEDDLQTAIGTREVALDFLQRVCTWFVYSWHAFHHNWPEAQFAARKFRKFMTFLVSLPLVARETLRIYNSSILWPVIGPTEILEQLCNRSLLCIDTVSLLCNLTRIEGFTKFLNERSSCISIIKNKFMECCLKMLEADELSGLLLLLMVNLTPMEGFAQFMIESNAAYFIKVVLLELITSNERHEYSAECAIWLLLKNLSLIPEGREIIMTDIRKFIGPILLPIAGPEQLCEEEMGGLPVEVLFLDVDKRRTDNWLVKDCILDLLYSLCRYRKDRIVIRDFDTYQILKYYHLAELDSELIDKIESVVNVLIRKEEEIGFDDMMEALKIRDDADPGEASGGASGGDAGHAGDGAGIQEASGKEGAAGFQPEYAYDP